MKTSFYRRIDDVSLAVADLCDYYSIGLIITRINVPAKHRNKGIGSALLKEITAAADASNTTLYLEIAPSGDLDYEQLEEWYKRHGFKPWKGIYRRRPNK